jgi:hypothetical protein
LEKVTVICQMTVTSFDPDYSPASFLNFTSPITCTSNASALARFKPEFSHSQMILSV